jgi:hypothetical protein
VKKSLSFSIEIDGVDSGDAADDEIAMTLSSMPLVAREKTKETGIRKLVYRKTVPTSLV